MGFRFCNMEECYCDWGSNGGDWCMCLGFFSGDMSCCEPCCGQPCNASDGLYCCLSFFPGCFCAAPQFYASSQNQSCALFNHALPYLLLLIPLIGSLFSLVFWTAIRFNLRRKFSIGKQEGVSPFDCLTVFCAPCFACQELRAVSKEDWDWYDAMNQYPMSPQSYRYLPLTSD